MKVIAGSETVEASVQLVATELDRIFDRKISEAQNLGPLLVKLWKLAAARTHGGKYVRPLALIETVSSLEAARPAADHVDPSILQSLAAALELLHFSFLLHDDVIDGDVMRRGLPNLIGEILAECDAGGDPVEPDRALHWARSCAILMGDLLLAEVHQLFARAPLSDEQRRRSLALLDTAITESVAGELIDVGMSDRVVAADLATILEMSRLKTATYSFELPLRLAAVLTDSPPSTEAALAAAGRHLGLAYQLHDDMLSTFGDATKHGKDAFSDLREGKETALIAYARMTSAWHLIEPHFGDAELNEHSAMEVRQILADCGAHRFVSSLIDDEFAAFDEVLSSSDSGLAQPARNSLRELAATLAARTS